MSSRPSSPGVSSAPSSDAPPARPRHPGEIFDRLYLRFAIADALQPLGIDADSAYRAAARVHILIAAPRVRYPPPPSRSSPGTTPTPSGSPACTPPRAIAISTRKRTSSCSGGPLCRSSSPPPKGFLSKTSATRITLRALEGQIDEATTAAAQSGYRLDKLLQPSPATAETSSTKSALAKKNRAGQKTNPSHPPQSTPSPLGPWWTRSRLQARGHPLPATAYRLPARLTSALPASAPPPAPAA